MLRLKKSQIEEFNDAGYVVLPGVFRDAEIREIGKAFDRLRDTGCGAQSRSPPVTSSVFFESHLVLVHFICPVARD
jgi:hypothetical protein